MNMSDRVPPTAAVPRFVGGGVISFEDRPVSTPGPGELLVAVRSNAVCGTDREQFADGSAVTPGHEAAGSVVAVGAGVTVAPGTPGVVYLMDYCGSCRSCLIGATNQCLAKRADMGFTKDGGYGPYELVHETNFFPIGTDVPLRDAPLLLDVMGTSRHAIGRARSVHPDPTSLLIAGAGPVGLGVAAMATLLAPDLDVYISDVVAFRLALGERLGATPLDVRDTGLGAQLAAHGRREVDVVIDTSGKQAARQAALRLLAKRGVFVCVGHGEGLSLEVSADLIAPERAILGSEYFRYDELAPNLEILRGHHSFLNQIITHRFPVREISRAFDTFFSGESGKVLVEH